MNSDTNIKISQKEVMSAIRQIPATDFSNKKYDSDHGQTLKGIIFLFSTPRSGSTLIGDLLYKSNFCLAHKYFQPYQYLPIFASRWNCLQDGFLDKESYIDQLVHFRTLPSGWLGISLHGHHLPIFAGFQEFFPSSERIFLRIRRRNIIAQAVSYEIASQTGRWSSNFHGTEVESQLSFKKIKNRLELLEHQNLLTDIFLSSVNENVKELFYEDFLLNPRLELNAILPQEFHANIEVESTLKKQASKSNEIWVDRFSQEYFSKAGDYYKKASKLDFLKQAARKFSGRL